MLLDLKSVDTQNMERRDVLKMGLAGLLAAAIPLNMSNEAYASTGNDVHRISFRHAHTGESFSGVYRVGDKYLPQAFERLNYVLRDFRTREVFPMDPRVIDIVAAVQRDIDPAKSFEVLSGYRSPKTNTMLRRAGTGVAKNSFHMYGQALDIRVPHYKTSYVRNVAKSLRAGGVGSYVRSGFVHLDTGKVRSW